MENKRPWHLSGMIYAVISKCYSEMNLKWPKNQAPSLEHDYTDTDYVQNRE